MNADLVKKSIPKQQQQSCLNKTFGKKSLNITKKSNLEHFGCGLSLNAEVEAGVLAVPHSGQGRRVLRRLLLQTGFPFFFQIL
jgi:hypothetical protein